MALDRALAGGARVADGALAVRASALSHPSAAYGLGSQLRRIVREAHDPPAPTVRARPMRVQPCRARVLAAEDELRLLASRLQSARPGAVPGIARVRLLLIDGTGPLYSCGDADNLRTAVSEAIAALND